jgi:hypothetical protein
MLTLPLTCEDHYQYLTMLWIFSKNFKKIIKGSCAQRITKVYKNFNTKPMKACVFAMYMNEEVNQCDSRGQKSSCYQFLIIWNFEQKIHDVSLLKAT